MSYHKINITQEEKHYKALGLTGPCYVKANSRNEALEEIYQHAKKSEDQNVTGDIKITSKSHFEVVGNTDNIHDFGNTHIFHSTNIWTKKQKL